MMAARECNFEPPSNVYLLDAANCAVRVSLWCCDRETKSVPGPNSWLFLAALVIAVGVLLCWLAVSGRIAIKVLAGTTAFAVSTLFGAALVNHFYDYYTSWGALYGDLSNSGTSSYSITAGYAPPIAASSPAPPPAHRHAFGISHASAPPPSPTPGAVPSVAPEIPTTVAIPALHLSAIADRGTGRVVELKLPGAVSGISRSAYVYLPAQYFEPAYAHVRFPVLELLHGDPGAPSNWIYGLNLRDVMDAAIQTGRVGPMVVVMPATFSGVHGNDCVDASGERNDTYLSHDVPADIVQDFRVLPQGPHWGIGGLSDGGFCAANLALRHRAEYGAVAAMDGFFTVDSDLGVLGRAFGNNAMALAANDPTTQVGDPNQSLPRFWIMAGTGNSVDLESAEAFRSVVLAREPVRYVVVEHGQHTPPSWRVALPDLLNWAWLTLSGQHSATGTEYLHVTNASQPPTSSGAPSSPPASSGAASGGAASSPTAS
jgi:S-formylglutathione hydrolase FrmB